MLLTLASLVRFSFYGTIGYAILGFLIWLASDHPKEVMFLYRLRFPRKILKTPAKLFSGAKNLYVTSESGNTIGVWHIPFENEELKNAKKVVLYAHGNAFTRGSKNRLIYYHILRNNGFHVITFDYSGFGDSTGSPDEKVVIKDTISVYKWMLDQIDNKDALIIMHGHSLGTSISTQALSKLSEEKGVIYPKFVILEAPFTCCRDALLHYPITKLVFALYPYFKPLFQRRIKKHNIEMNTLQHLPMVKSHVLILHAEDDDKVHYEMGYELFKATKSNPSSQNYTISFFGFDKKHKLKHFPTQYSNFGNILNNYLTETGTSSSGKEAYF